MGTGLSYWQITTSEADVEAGYKEANLEFTGYLCDMPIFIKKHTDCPFYRLDVWNVELDCYRRPMDPEHLGNVEEHLIKHDRGFNPKKWDDGFVECPECNKEGLILRRKPKIAMATKYDEFKFVWEKCHRCAGTSYLAKE